eukprot:scaffold903_cov91-Cyclotella_meneghiniana.AAC.2
MGSKQQLRIASLLPSTTDICTSLGLQSNIVGITHECDYPSTIPLISHTRITDGNNHDQSTPQEHHRPLTLTVSHIDPSTQSQSDIDTAVKTSLHNGISLYHLNDTALSDAKPSIILTQSLCDVCAVSEADVQKEVTCHLPTSKLLSLEPESLQDVADTFVSIADACGVRERGVDLKRFFFEDIDKVSLAVSLHVKDDKPPTIMFLEWIDPPFDGGHWIPDMIERSGCCVARAMSENKSTKKSVQLDWDRVYESDPDVVIVACCGFDLKRNIQDALSVQDKLKPLRAFREGKVFAADGNLYFARPGPALREGVAIMARVAFYGNRDVVNALDKLGFVPQEDVGWARLTFEVGSNEILDMEDLATIESCSYSKCHDDACKEGKLTYVDPKTGYTVFTELAHKSRGKCCGSGCRHCPYNHINVKDKSKKIQQPAFLYEGCSDNSEEQNVVFSHLSNIPTCSDVKILFFSGGKDSFLTIRKLVKQHKSMQNGESKPFHLILLTTFDYESRIIAHQEINIDTVIKQASHLEIPLLAIPLCRASGETYLSRIEKGLDAIRTRIDGVKLTLVFGDLHLDYIRDWREKELSAYPLEYPLWKTPYVDLITDLEASQVPVVLSASTKDGIKEGMFFTRDFMNKTIEMGLDGFGENGEFHSVAQVWSVSKDQALGLIANE